MGRIISLGCVRLTKRYARRRKPNWIRKVQQRRNAHQVSAFPCQYTQRLREKCIIPCRQPDTTRERIKHREPQIARSGPNTISACQVNIAILPIDALWINQQDRIVISEEGTL